MSHASQTAHHATSSSIRFKAIPTLAALLLCANACMPISAYAAVYDSSVVEGSDIAEGPSSGGQSGEPIVLQSLESSGTALRSVAIEANAVLDASAPPETFEKSIVASPAESFNGDTYSLHVVLPLVWDFSVLDTSNAILQEVTATAILPDGYLWKDGSSSLTFTKLVSVQEPNQPRLDIHNDSSSVVFFPWVAPDSFTKSDIHAFFAVEGGEFSSLETNDCGWVQDDGLALYASDLVEGMSYRLRIEYPGGYSEADFFYSSGNALIVDTVTGDRDGGDGEGDGPAQGEQPIPEAPPLGATGPEQSEGDDSASLEPTGGENAEQNNASQNPPAPTPSTDLLGVISGGQAYADTVSPLPEKQLTSERYSACETTIAGTRLADLCAASETVSFDQNGVVVSIPSTFLASLGVRPSDTFSVYAQKTAHNRVTIALAVKNRMLSSSPGMSVRLSYEASEKDARIDVLDENETVVAQGSLAGSSLTFSVDKPGAFLIAENGVAATDGSLLPAEKQSHKETATAYGANISDAHNQVEDHMESPLLLALAFCVVGVLAAAGGYGILVFLRK